MVDSDGGFRVTIEQEKPHQDGKIELGNHSDRLSDLTGQPTPESFPISFFELQDGQVTLEQVRVLHFFIQEYRNKAAILRNRPYLFDKYIKKYESTQNPTDAQNLKTKATENLGILKELDFITGEAEELLDVLGPVLVAIEGDQAPMIAAEERQRRVDDAKKEIQELEAERAQIEEAMSSDRTDSQNARYAYTSKRIDELKVILKTYQVPPQEVAVQKQVMKNAQLKSLLLQREETGDTSRDQEIQELQGEVLLLEDMLADYDAFVEREMQKPVRTAEAQRLRDLTLDLQLAVAEYQGPLIPGVNVIVPDRVAMVTLLKHPVVAQLMPELAGAVA